MIVRPRPHTFGLFFILRGSIVPTIMPKILAVLALSAGVTWAHRAAPQFFRDLSPAPFTLFGLALSIFLGFRNNACYDRWWEARRQWGQLVAEVRGLMRDAAVLFPDEPGLRQRFAGRVIAFAHALRNQLRDEGGADVGERLDPAEWERVRLARSRPDVILLSQAEELAALLRKGALSDILYQAFSARLQALTTVQSACERLRSTPTPFTYMLLLHRTAWLFCLLVPFGLVGTLDLATPLVTAILAYAFFGLDALGDELEEPFGRSQNAIPLDALVRTIEIATLEALGETNLPPPAQPIRYLLL